MFLDFQRIKILLTNQTFVSTPHRLSAKASLETGPLIGILIQQTHENSLKLYDSFNYLLVLN